MRLIRSGGKRIAFFGGSFDPPHLGHLAVARAALTALGLDTVLFAPVGAQPLKLDGSAASFEDRVMMTRLAIAGEPGFEISLADTPKASGGPNYTLETLQSVRAGLQADAELFCLMGADSFAGLRRWYRAAEIPFAASLIVAARPGRLLDDLTPLLPQGLSVAPATDRDLFPSGIEVRSFLLENSKGETAPFYILPGVHVEISASQIRDMVRGQAGPGSGYVAGEDKFVGEPLLPAAVTKWIVSRGLYR